MFEAAVEPRGSSRRRAKDAERILVPDRARLLLGVAEHGEVARSITDQALDASFCKGNVVYADGGYTAR